jgi:hypothetical protein
VSEKIAAPRHGGENLGRWLLVGVFGVVSAGWD